MKPDGRGDCFVGQMLEIYARDSNYHPQMFAPKDGEGVNFRNVRIRTDPFQWPLWEDGRYGTRGSRVSPYTVCWSSKYHRWRSGKAVACNGDEIAE